MTILSPVEPYHIDPFVPAMNKATGCEMSYSPLTHQIRLVARHMTGSLPILKLDERETVPYHLTYKLSSVPIVL